MRNKRTKAIKRERVALTIDPEVTRALKSLLALSSESMSLFCEQAALQRIKSCGNAGIISSVTQLKKP